MREIRMSGSMRGGRKRAFARRACLLLYGVLTQILLLSRINSFVRSARSQLPIFRRTHVSAFTFCKSLFR